MDRSTGDDLAFQINMLKNMIVPLSAMQVHVSHKSHHRDFAKPTPIAQVHLFVILVQACASVRPMSFGKLG